MPIPTSDEFQEIVSGPHTNSGRVDVEVEGTVVDTLYPTAGQVQVASDQAIHRNCSFTIIDDERKYTPQGAADLFNPLSGTVLRPYLGVEKPRVETVSIVMDTEEQWNTATFTNAVVDGFGRVTIA